MQITILGCGASSGTPTLATGWAECDPSEPRAVAAMESLLEDDELAPDVVEVLEPVYRQTQATEKVAALFDVRIHLADTEGERVRFLQDQAVVYESELGDSTRALAHWSSKTVSPNRTNMSSRRYLYRHLYH